MGLIHNGLFGDAVDWHDGVNSCDVLMVVMVFDKGNGGSSLRTFLIIKQSFG